MLNKTKKYIILILFILICTFCLSCNNKSPLDEFGEKMSKSYPNGFDNGENWYEITSFTNFEIKELHEKTYKKCTEYLNFIGNIDFEQNRLRGTSKQFKIIKESFVSENDVPTHHYVTEYYLVDGLYLTIEKSIDLKSGITKVTTVGSENFDVIDIHIDANNDFLFFDSYTYLSTLYDSLIIKNDHITFDVSKDINKHTHQSEKFGFYFNDDYLITKIYYHREKISNKLTYDQNSLFINRALSKVIKVCDQVNIVAPTINYEIVNNKDFYIEI